jgi:hypothetical protein
MNFNYDLSTLLRAILWASGQILQGLLSVGMRTSERLFFFFIDSAVKLTRLGLKPRPVRPRRQR